MEALYAMIGCAMIFWKSSPELVDTLFDVNLMWSTPQVVPGAAWNPATRRITGHGEFGEAEVNIPASVAWDRGDLYQLWLTARNARGASDPGPPVSWTAP